MLIVGEALLLERGLTAREATGVRVRYRRLHKGADFDEALERTLLSLDVLDLQPGQAAHLLRSFDLETLGADCQRAAARTQRAPRWCSYKKALCDCAALQETGDSSDGAAAGAPRFLAIDCEFKPLRLAAVDEHGCIRRACLSGDHEPRRDRTHLPRLHHGSPSDLLVRKNCGHGTEVVRKWRRSGAEVARGNIRSGSGSESSSRRTESTRS